MNHRALDQLVQQIVEIVRPLRIVVFGSAARGEFSSARDIDLLVVMPNGVHRRKTAQMLYQKVRGLRVPFDLVVATPDDLKKHRDNLGLIYRTALMEGQEVYAAP